MLTACLFDRLVGDPRGLLHPVQVMGWSIGRLRGLLEPLSGGNPLALRLAGVLITALVVGASAAVGWALERLLLASLAPINAGVPASAWLGGGALVAMVLALASALAGRSLEQAVRQVLSALPPASAPAADLAPARQHLSWIVGRDVDRLETGGILRACAETASENAVDGLFAPLFWMLLGSWLWQIPGAPGPLSLAWAFKAASTLDSMLGYRRGTLLWLGTAGARLDDLLTWIPCRLVAFSLPLVSRRPLHPLRYGRRALRQGAADPSPNAGVSQAIYALLLGIQLGGESLYGGVVRQKPLVGVIAPESPLPTSRLAVEAILALTVRLQGLWLVLSGLLILVLSITKALS